jgi:hypothetical protein
MYLLSVQIKQNNFYLFIYFVMIQLSVTMSSWQMVQKCSLKKNRINDIILFKIRCTIASEKLIKSMEHYIKQAFYSSLFSQHGIDNPNFLILYWLPLAAFCFFQNKPRFL